MLRGLLTDIRTSRLIRRLRGAFHKGALGFFECYLRERMRMTKKWGV
jgi:hypothetical protein